MEGAVSEMPTEKARFTVIVDDELLKKIDDFRFQNRYGSRSSSAVELIQIAMKELEKKDSSDELQKNKPALSEQEEKLLSLYRQLDEQKQEELLDFANYKRGQKQNPPPAEITSFGGRVIVSVFVFFRCFPFVSVANDKER